MYRTFGKRLLDLALVIPALILLLPVMLLVGFLVYFKLGRPILFRQVRPGLHGRPFSMYKFRTMLELRDDKDSNLLPDEQRLTIFSRFLRKTSLDELPELWNVLRGEMSLVGPRPLLIRYLDRYTPEQARRHEVAPGITGLAQINGRNAAAWETRLAMDVWYVDNLSLWLDIKIMATTVRKVLSREGALEGGSRAEEFWGIQGSPPSGPLVYPVEQDETLLLDHP
jgi:lipopolysaccharide/colanic/teichoic acid biosynthesis glycosyltransferase